MKKGEEKAKNWRKLEELDEVLREAGELLDKAAIMVRDTNLNSKSNIRKIGRILTHVFEIRMQVFERRPDLKPQYLENGKEKKKAIKAV